MNPSETAFEGNSLEETLAEACEGLNVGPDEIEYRLDRAHFANGADTIRIFAAKKDPANEGIADQLLAFLVEEFKTRELEAHCRSKVTNRQARVLIEAQPGVVPDDEESIATLTEVLRDLVSEHLGERTLDVTVRAPLPPEPPSYNRDRGDRDRGGRDRDRGPRGRGDRDRGGRDRDRGGRDRDRGGRDRDRGPRDRDRPRPERDPKREEDLRNQAKAAVEQVLEDGEPVTIEELNSYERRLIHREVAEVAGLTTRSIGRGSLKAVRIMEGEDEDSDG